MNERDSFLDMIWDKKIRNDKLEIVCLKERYNESIIPSFIKLFIIMKVICSIGLLLRICW